MPSLPSLISVAFAILLCVPGSASPLLFESRCDSTAPWDLLDLAGDASLRVEEDFTVPPGYGPKVIRFDCGQGLLLVKGLHLKEGTMLALWKDEAPLDADGDGVLLFQADYGDDLSEAHNTKQARHHFWVEQDADAGFQIKEETGKDNTRTHIELAGTGLTQDPWNKTGWIWQKLAITDGMLRAKFWSSAESEPEKWQIEIPGWKPEAGRVGLKVWSGHTSIAYFAISENDLPVTVPPMDLQVNTPVCYALEKLKATVFLNQPQALPDATIHLKVVSGTGEAETKIMKDFPTGSSEVIFSVTGEELRFPESMTEGKVTLTADLLDSSGAEMGHAARVFDYRSMETFRKRMEWICRAINLDTPSPSNGYGPPHIALSAAVAQAHLDLAKRRISEGKEAEAEKSLAYAEEAIAWCVEPQEYEEDTPSQTEPPKPGQRRFQKDAPRDGKIIDWLPDGVGEEEPDWRDPRVCAIKSDNYSVSADSMVMGETYEVWVIWHSPVGSPTEALTARLTLTDDISANTPISMEVPLPPKAWSAANRAQSGFRFRLPEEFPSGRKQPIELPAIREGYHRLWLSLHRPDGSAVWLDMPNPEAGSYTDRYQIARVYVTQNPVEIAKMKVIDQKGDPKALNLSLRNTSATPLHNEVTLSILTKCGAAVWTGIKPVDLAEKGTSPIAFDFSDLKWFGELTLQVEVSQGQTIHTRAEETIELWCPGGCYHDWPLTTTKIAAHDGKPITQIVVNESLADSNATKVRAQVKQADRIVYNKVLVVPPEDLYSENLKSTTTVLEVEPALGTYDVTLSITDEQGVWWSTEIPVIAPVFENRDGVLYLNGEPFIVKGVNVHGMIGHSPERNRQMLRFLKDIGFNTMRGDFPPPWQVEMAGEENLGYMVLPPFSVNSTDYFKKMYAPHPFPKMREITRRFIKTYRDLPAMWFWNSCNEVTGEIEDLLVSVYPLYKLMDPAQRPVVYANLYGQDETVGQDLMAVNYYFGVGQDAASRQPLIKRSIAKAREAGIPCIFTEFNCWYGPVYSRGVEALEGLYEYGLSQGMAGGCLYLLAEDPGRHPAVIGSRENLWTNPTYIAALHHAFDDAEVVSATSTHPGIHPLEVRNRRDFWLRKVRYEVHEGNRPITEGTLEDIAPRESAKISLGDGEAKGAHVYEAQVWFETHHGLRGQVKNRVLVGESTP